jgi:NADH:ubiquinone oxidoreductase subunit 4 (subunit M)
LNRRELTIMGALAAAIVWIGIYPAPVLRRTEASAAKFVQTVQSGAAQRVSAFPLRRR